MLTREWSPCSVGSKGYLSPRLAPPPVPVLPSPQPPAAAMVVVVSTNPTFRLVPLPPPAL